MAPLTSPQIPLDLGQDPVTADLLKRTDTQGFSSYLTTPPPQSRDLDSPTPLSLKFSIEEREPNNHQWLFPTPSQDPDAVTDLCNRTDTQLHPSGVFLLPYTHCPPPPQCRDPDTPVPLSLIYSKEKTHDTQQWFVSLPPAPRHPHCYRLTPKIGHTNQ